jgi:hypothetical protein
MILKMGGAADEKNVLTNPLAIGMRGGPSAADDRHTTGVATTTTPSPHLITQ